MPKLTFSLDEPTVRALETTSGRLGKPKSLVGREAIADYAGRAGPLTELERRRLLKAFDELVNAIPARPCPSTAAEIRQIRRERSEAGRTRE